MGHQEEGVQFVLVDAMLSIVGASTREDEVNGAA